MSDASHKSVPEWAKDKACALFNEVCGEAGTGYVPNWRPLLHGNHPTVIAFARYIASVEEASVDPRVDAMKAAWWANRSPESLEDAFRTELAKRGLKIVEAMATTPSNVGADASRGPELQVADIRDLLEDAISDSLDMDWQPSWAVDSIIHRLAEEGIGFINMGSLTRAAGNLERYPFESATMAEGALMAATALRKAVTDPASIGEIAGETK